MTDRSQPGFDLAALDEALDSFSDGIMIFDADLRVRALNASYRRLFELQPDEIVPGDDIAKVLTVLAGCGMLDHNVAGTETEIARRLAGWRSAENRHEIRHLRNGRVVEIRRHDTPDGGMLSVHVERTDAEAREREIERQRTLLQSIFANINDGLALVDENGRFIAFNDTFLDLYGVPRDAVRWGVHFFDLAQHFADLKPLTPERRQTEIDRRYRFACDPTRTRIVRNLFDGRALEIVKTVLSDQTAVLCLRDITGELRRRREVEEARRRAESSSQQRASFIAHLSHEMRNSLSGVLGMASVLGRSELTPRQREQVDLISKSGAMLLRLINDALDLSRIEAETTGFEPARFSLGEVLEECVRTVEPSARDKGLDLTVDMGGPALPAVMGDAVRLKQVLLNLLTNAVKFTEAGSVDLTAAVEIGSSEAAIALEVADTGIGIAPAEREAIFREFYQVGSGGGGTSRGGVGLGLAISHRLMQAMGGSIEVADREPSGTRFTLRLILPLAEGDGDCSSSVDDKAPLAAAGEGD